MLRHLLGLNATQSPTLIYFCFRSGYDAEWLGSGVQRLYDYEDIGAPQQVGSGIVSLSYANPFRD